MGRSLQQLITAAAVITILAPTSSEGQRWSRQKLDEFVCTQHVEAKVSPTAEANRSTLIRRLSLDLLGLPPTPDEVDAYTRDPSPDAYERLVDRLLASPRFGERLAQLWLDLARYADSDGYHDDAERSMWQYRDWVIDAFNNSKPFDQFTIEQLAGDLLHNATLEQRVATAFLRNGPTSTEDGANPEEYRARYAVDRVNVTSKIWLGLTMECAECHDHKYDPISTREYYQLFAFFNQTPERPLYRGLNSPPSVAVPSNEDLVMLSDLENRIAGKEQLLKTSETGRLRGQWKSELLADRPQTRREETITCEFRFRGEGANQLASSGPRRGAAMLRPSSTGQLPTFTAGLLDGAIEFRGDGDAVDLGQLVEFRRSLGFTIEAWLRCGESGGTLISKIDKAAESRGFDVKVVDGRVSVRLIDSWPDAAIMVSTIARYSPRSWLHLSISYDGSSTPEGLHIYVNGEAQDLIVDARSELVKRIRNRSPAILGGSSDTKSSFHGAIDEVRFHKWPLATPDLVEAPRPMLRDVLQQQGTITKQSVRFLNEFFRGYVNPTTVALRHEITALRREKELATPRLRVMRDTADRRATHVLIRGDFRNPGEQVRPNTPSMLAPLPPKPVSSGAYSRLDLARWLVSPDNTSTARVTTNRIWAHLFGRGIVASLDDFGVQGESATHPDLLDDLASELVRREWDIKSLVRLIVTSATYRQSSAVSEDVWQTDPANKLLARGPRKRLSAEAVRDNSLRISGLLSNRIGGPSVRPYQPTGLWRDMSKGNEDVKAYRQSHGEDLYRRGIYTFWKRSIHYPAFAVFDAPSREVCTSSRPTTNTPTQALAVLNDPTFVESARVFAAAITRQGIDSDDRIQFAFHRALGRRATPHEAGILRNIQQTLADDFRKDPVAAAKFVGVGETMAGNEINSVELATWTGVAQIILSLDETITQE